MSHTRHELIGFAGGLPSIPAQRAQGNGGRSLTIAAARKMRLQGAATIFGAVRIRCARPLSVVRGAVPGDERATSIIGGERSTGHAAICVALPPGLMMSWGAAAHFYPEIVSIVENMYYELRELSIKQIHRLMFAFMIKGLQ
jgi:hypothetical protein